VSDKESKPKVAVLPLVLERKLPALPYLALGMLTAYARSYKGGILPEAYDIERVMVAGHEGAPLKAIYRKATESPNPVCLFSSYVWNHALNRKAAKHIKDISPGCLVIFGGPHVPKYLGETESFLRENPFVDVAVIGEGELALAEILEAFASTPRQKRNLNKLEGITGIVYRNGDAFKRTPDRQRLADIDVLPSPYLTGEFEPWFEDLPSTILETNRGCPYGCTYCDWGSATLSKVTRFAPERVVKEIEYIAEKRSEAIFIADANFGMLEQDIEIAKALVDVKRRTGYPHRVATNFAKNGGRRLMAVIKILHEGGLLPTGIIALQTTDRDVLKAIARDNIKTEAYEKMMTYFNSENIPMASDLMIGLPGQTVESFANDLQFCFDWKVAAVANYTSMMPNAPMAEASYREQYQILATDDDMVQSTSSFSPDDMRLMKLIYITYLFHVRYGVLRYILYFLQIDHQIPAIAFLRRWLDLVSANDPNLPISSRVLNEVLQNGNFRDWASVIWSENANFLFEAPEAYYEEILQFSEREYGVELTAPAIRSLTQAQQAIMPRTGRKYPYQVTLECDIVSYIKQIKDVASIDGVDGQIKRLTQWGEGVLSVVADTDQIEDTAFEYSASHADAWELASEIRFY